MKDFDALLETIRILRSPKGCPWDRVQTVDNMTHYLLEEVYELIDAIAAKNHKSIKEELGDIFLILIVIAEMFSEKNKFKVSDVLKEVNKKLITRHPHVFSSKKLNTKGEVLKHWIKSKAKAKKRKSIKNRLPLNAPSLLLANILFKELAHVKGKKTKDLPIERISKSIKKLGSKENSKNTLATLMMDICSLAYIRGVDLELDLRKKVLKKAEITSYNHKKK